jgi:hypothetical protein
MSLDVMKQALAALEDYEPNEAHKVAVALRAAIEQAPWVKSYAGGKPNYTVPEEKQEPVAYMNQNGVIHHADYEWLGAGNILTPLYTHPPQHKPLTDEHVLLIGDRLWEAGHTISIPSASILWVARAIEAAHGIKGEK